jgi:predicted metal-binding protein
MNTAELEKYCDLAVELGASDCKLTLASQVEVADWTRWKCQFGCGYYGKSLLCPPYTPKPEETRKMLEEYDHALLFRSDPKKNKKLTVELERRIFLDGYYSAAAFSAGPCRLCEKCNIEGGYCLRPREARPSMEGCGINVYRTARNLGYDINVLTSRDQEYLSYGLVLIA